MEPRLEIVTDPADPDQENALRLSLAGRLGREVNELPAFRVHKRSLDARRNPVYRYQIELSSDNSLAREPEIRNSFKEVRSAPAVVIVGAGPAGYFAALECLLLGLRPIVLDRGKDVKARRRDLKAIQQDHIVNPDSNYCFGEGGAGTYSDGKLYTRSGKRGDIGKILRLFVEHGADPDILIDAHPHIGSNKLPGIVEEIRASILRFGGEVHFNQRVVDFSIRDRVMKSVISASGAEFPGEAFILATGHSSRDIYHLLHRKNLRMDAKPFALGVRIEHPQQLIDQIQYNKARRESYLPAASYSLSCTFKERGVFSFCMCPGGLMVPAATAPGEIVINGMSLSRRDSRFANSGMVAAVFPSDFKNPADPFCCLEFQQEVEQSVFRAGDGSQRAPGQRLTDFLNNKISVRLPDASYIPGLWSAPVHELLPAFIIKSLNAGLRQFAKQMKGYITDEAVVVATESRTSSPVRIPRNSLSMHPDCEALFPCGEGAGYAGGIVSAAMDGQHCAKAALQYILK